MVPVMLKHADFKPGFEERVSTGMLIFYFA
jgi:hypothetical protein